MPVNAGPVSWHTLRLAALLIAITFAQPVLADDWDTCAKGAGDDAISACTRAIKSGTYNGRTLALAYSNRGVEWKAKGELAKAIWLLMLRRERPQRVAPGPWCESSPIPVRWPNSAASLARSASGSGGLSSDATFVRR